MADTTLTVAFEADTSDLQQGIDQMQSLINGMVKPLGPATDYFNRFFDAVIGGSDQMLAGILRGTQTWQQAMSRVFSNLLASYINTLVITPVLGWIQSEAEITGISIQANAARNADNEAAGVVAAAQRAQQASAMITADAAQAYSGVFAFLAPVMGPAAAGPAAASEAQVLGQLGLVSLDVGAWNVPRDMPAYLHAGEMVVPQQFASGLRGGSGFGGDNYNITINAIDTQTGAQFLKNNASVIAQTLSTQARNFNRHLPAWKQ